MEPEASTSSMTLGLTCAAFVLVMGELEMSVCADSTGVEIIDDSTSAQHTASRSEGRVLDSIPRFLFIMLSIEESGDRRRGEATAYAFIADRSVEIENAPKVRGRRTDALCLRTARMRRASVVVHTRPATKGKCASVSRALRRVRNLRLESHATLGVACWQNWKAARHLGVHLQACTHLPEKLWPSFTGLPPCLRSSRSAVPR